MGLCLALREPRGKSLVYGSVLHMYTDTLGIDIIVAYIASWHHSTVDIYDTLVVAYVLQTARAQLVDFSQC